MSVTRRVNESYGFYYKLQLYGSRSRWRLACWDSWFESRRGHECLSLVSVVGCQVEVYATGRSIVQGEFYNAKACVCVTECDQVQR